MRQEFFLSACGYAPTNRSKTSPCLFPPPKEGIPFISLLFWKTNLETPKTKKQSANHITSPTLRAPNSKHSAHPGHRRLHRPSCLPKAQIPTAWSLRTDGYGSVGRTWVTWGFRRGDQKSPPLLKVLAWHGQKDPVKLEMYLSLSLGSVWLQRSIC